MCDTLYETTTSSKLSLCGHIQNYSLCFFIHSFSSYLVITSCVPGITLGLRKETKPTKITVLWS